jgi:hypothetical protein
MSMAISIRNPRVERLARDLAHRKGTTMTEVIVEALEASLAGNDGDYTPRRDALAKIAAECAVLPDLDKRSPEEILGYGTAGEFADGNR